MPSEDFQPPGNNAPVLFSMISGRASVPGERQTDKADFPL